MQADAPTYILYDGNCPLCVRKKEILLQRDKQKRLHFIDIRSPSFSPKKYSRTPEILEQQIHAILPDGTLAARMEAIRAAYRAIGLGWLIAPTGWPVLRPMFDHLYTFIARHRMKLSRWMKLN